ncbi:hypothetical protein MSG28_004118 [Choristoneura fumiferana]|uniref:Uncharacterized protein n=1 Tax=Choristoneura fumiferana TaxID=7141 RepID=A0ACC0KHG3_CHOFU|nr:hypothetical protein MSG28_004118 [Choristoneura fumiferana]
MLVLILLMMVWNSLAHPQDLAWYGGPWHLGCEHGAHLLTNSGQYIKDNAIAIKAVSFNDEIYVITPRLKHGVLATVWRVVRERSGPELEPYPSLAAHAVGDCYGIQNAVDFHLDYLGNLWVLDSGVVDALDSPHCTCKPKVVVISTILRKITKRLDLSSLTDSSSLLQYVVSEYVFGGKPFIYISDASRGAILVHDTSSQAEWSVLICTPAAGLQIALVRRGTHGMLVAVRINYPGIFEIDTAALRRRDSGTPLRVFGEHGNPIYLLGSDAHHIYLRASDSADVMVWDAREGFNASRLISIHSPAPRLISTSATVDPFKHTLLILDSNYADVVHSHLPAYQRISFIGQL